MNILYLAHRVPYPPNKGDKLRSFNEISFLSRNHKVSLVCLTDDIGEASAPSELIDRCVSVDIVYLPSFRSKIQSLIGLFSGRPLTLSYFYSQKLKSLVENKLAGERFDLIFIYCSSMATYVEHVRDIPKVIDFVDVDSEKWLQYSMYAKAPMKYVYRLESRRLRKYESLISSSFNHSFFVSEKETEDFLRLVSPCVTATPILNGVDREIFRASHEQYNPLSIVFTGAMDYFANVEAVLYFVREIFPFIRRAVPGVRFYVVGSKPARAITRLPEIHQDVIVTGFVKSVQPYLAGSAVFVAPMRIARGVQNKILEAMSMGLPVVTSSLGFEGIAARAGTDIFVEDLPERFSEKVIMLIQDKELRDRISKVSMEIVKKYYDWSTNLNKLEEILISVHEGHRQGRAPQT